MPSFLEERANLAGRVAIVTGGAGGLGLPITLDLARAGVAVAVCDRDPEAVAAVTAQLADLGVARVVRCFDVRDSEELAAFFDEVDRELGRLDILVNVPGGSYRSPLLDMSRKGTDAVIRQNFTYVLEAAQLAVRRMEAQGTGGSIVNITSIEGHRAMPAMGVYGAMKAAVAHLTMTLAVELGPMGVRVNAVAPDLFPTPATRGPGWSMADELGPLPELQNSITIPLGRKGIGSDLSGCVLFLASDLAAYVTGTTLHVDGGTMAAGGWSRWPDGYDNLIPEQVLVKAMEPDGEAAPD